jgi:hypothetical protein
MAIASTIHRSRELLFLYISEANFCLRQGQPSGRDLMRLQSLVDVVTNLVAGGATFAACSRPPSGPEQEQDTAPFAASSPGLGPLNDQLQGCLAGQGDHVEGHYLW